MTDPPHRGAISTSPLSPCRVQGAVASTPQFRPAEEAVLLGVSDNHHIMAEAQLVGARVADHQTS